MRSRSTTAPLPRREVGRRARRQGSPHAEGAAKGQEFVFACVGNDDDLRAVTTGPEVPSPAWRKARSSTTTPRPLPKWRANSAAAAADLGFSFIDAPVSGGQAGAENGVLTVMCGGDEQAFARAEPVIMSFARASRRLGPSGAGQLTKMVNQICIAGLVQALSEGVHFARKAGLDVEAVIETISKGAAQSWQMENRYKTMNADKFDFGFAVDWMRKDLRSASRRPAATAQPAGDALVDQFYAEVQKMGGNRWDTSSLFARLER